MTATDKVRATKSPRDAILVLAGEIDALAAQIAELSSDPGWDDWGDDDEPEPAPLPEGVGPDGLTASARAGHEAALRAMNNTEPREFEIPAPSSEKQAARRMLEQQRLRIAAALGADAGDTDWTEAYVKGGPWWFWQTNRDLMLGYDYSVRQSMVADLEEDAPDLAYEMSLDVLKRESAEPDLETGAGAMAPQGWIEAKVRQ